MLTNELCSNRGTVALPRCGSIDEVARKSAIAQPLLRDLKRNWVARDCSVGVEIVFIVQGKPRTPEGIVKVVKETRKEALRAARDLLDRGMVVVTIIGDGRVYTVDEFGLTFISQA
jgi:hypothetical protein